MPKLTTKQMDELKFDIITEFFTEMERANEKGRLQEFLCKKCSKEFCEKRCAKYFVRNDQKILIIGDIRLGKSDIERISESLCIGKDSIEIVNKYKQLHTYDFDKLINSKKYSDIIIAAVPHKTKGTHGSSSIIAYIENNMSKYPNMIRATAGGKLKLTACSLERALKQTNMYKNIWAL